MAKLVFWKPAGGIRSAERLFWKLPGGARLAKIIFWRPPEGARSAKIISWRPPGGARLTKIMFSRPPGGARSAKIMFWRLWEKVWFWDKSLQTAQQPPGGNPQKHSFPLVLQHSGYSRGARDSPSAQILSQPSFPEPRSSLHAGGPGPQRILGFCKPYSQRCELCFVYELM